MAQTKLVYTTAGQIAILPESLASPQAVDQVDIVKFGRTLLVSPLNATWDALFDGPSVSDDFLEQRVQTTLDSDPSPSI